MKNAFPAIAITLALCLLPGLAGCRSTQRESRLDLSTLTSVPEGHYRINLETEGRHRTMNVRVTQAQARCVASDDPGLVGASGTFHPVGNGVFQIFFSNPSYRASQVWLFRPDGSAVVKEVPDRGERQFAVRVNDISLDLPGRR